jgi:hypothetical protein
MTAIKLPNFIKKQPVALGCALLCAALAVAIYLGRDALAKATDDLAQKKSEGEHFRENVTNAGKLDEQFESITRATQAIEARLVHADQLAINLQYFYKLESETQTKLTDLRQTGVTTSTKNTGKTNYVGVAYSIGVQGTYPQLLDFMRRVENGEHFSRVLGLTLSRAGGGETATPGNTGVLSLNLNLELLGLP